MLSSFFVLMNVWKHLLVKVIFLLEEASRDVKLETIVDLFQGEGFLWCISTAGDKTAAVDISAAERGVAAVMSFSGLWKSVGSAHIVLHGLY